MQLPLPTDNSSLLDLCRLLEFSDGLAWEDQFRCAPDYIRDEFGLHIDRLGSAVVLSLFRAPDPFYNRLVGLGLYEPVTEWMLDELMGYIYGTETEFFQVQVSPAAQPPELAGWLEQRGFWHVDAHAKFYRNAAAVEERPTSLRIERTGPDFADAFAFVASQAFGMPDVLYPWQKATIGQPGWHHYVAWANEDPVAAGALFVRDGIGWLGHGSTLPSHRRLGAQGALLARRMNDGLALGCRIFVTETDVSTPEYPVASFRNMLRSGFKLAYQRENYIFDKGR